MEARWEARLCNWRELLCGITCLTKLMCGVCDQRASVGRGGGTETCSFQGVTHPFREAMEFKKRTCLEGFNDFRVRVEASVSLCCIDSGPGVVDRVMDRAGRIREEESRRAPSLFPKRPSERPSVAFVLGGTSGSSQRVERCPGIRVTGGNRRRDVTGKGNSAVLYIVVVMRE